MPEPNRPWTIFFQCPVGFFCACLHLFPRPPAAARKAFNFHAASRTETGRVRLRSFGMLAGRLKQNLDVRPSHLLET